MIELTIPTTVGTSHLDGRRAPVCRLFTSLANGECHGPDQREGSVRVDSSGSPAGQRMTASGGYR